MSKYEIVQTGGGCEAYRHPMDSEGYVLITDEDGLNLPENGATALFGVYDDNDEFIESFYDTWVQDWDVLEQCAKAETKMDSEMQRQERRAQEETGCLRWSERNMGAVELAKNRIKETHDLPEWCPDFSQTTRAVY